MLFPYTYVPHKIEKMQSFIDFIFFEVWCNANASGLFRFELFDTNLELKGLIQALYYSDTEGGDYFYNHVELIYNIFSSLTAVQINQLRQWYIANNDIEKVCANDPAYQVARYKDVIGAYPALGKKLASFFRGLYDNSFLALSPVKSIIGDIKSHNHEFFTKNNVGKCPFCGISDLKGIHHTRREAYDHYLPKYKYPFNSINFRNLAPACNDCNSSYKLSKDPLQNSIGRRKAFYPYTTNATNAIEIKLSLHVSNIDLLNPASITLQFGPTSLSEELGTWKDVYGIEERYKAKLCGENEGKYLLTQILDESIELGLSSASYFAVRSKTMAASPYADTNFLRKPFLDACKEKGLFV